MLRIDEMDSWHLMHSTRDMRMQRSDPCYGKPSCRNQLAVPNEAARIDKEWDGNTNSSATRVLRQGDPVCGSQASPKGNYPSPTKCAPPASKAHNMSDIEVAGPPSALSPARTANPDP
eukprot:Gb_02865 [translate_table: standard]